MARAALVLVFVVGCGARSGLEVWPAEPVDAGRDASAIDAPLDAPAPSACPPPSRFGFDLVGAHAIAHEPPYGEVSLGGDGTTVVLASELRARADFTTVTWSLDGTGGEIPGTETRYPGLFRPRVSVVAGVARLFLLASGPLLHFATPGLAGSTTTDVLHGPLVRLDRPIWNGAELVVAGQNEFELFLGAFAPGGSAPNWRSFGPATDVHAAADPTTGITALLYRDGAGDLRVETFAAGGAALWPPGGTVLEDIGLVGPLALGLLEDGTAQPWVVAGFTEGDLGDTIATLRRFRTDGTAAGGFSTTIAGEPGAIDLTTVAPAGHRSGYGLIVSGLGSGVYFHGAGEDFVGDAQPVSMICGTESISIASGPCGYVLACGGGTIITTLAVPPRPR